MNEKRIDFVNVEKALPPYSKRNHEVSNWVEIITKDKELRVAKYHFNSTMFSTEEGEILSNVIGWRPTSEGLDSNYLHLFHEYHNGTHFKFIIGE